MVTYSLHFSIFTVELYALVFRDMVVSSPKEEDDHDLTEDDLKAIAKEQMDTHQALFWIRSVWLRSKSGPFDSDPNPERLTQIRILDPVN